MVDLAIDIVSFCIVAAAVLAAVIAAAAILGTMCSAFDRWLDAAPGRRRRVRRAFWSLLALGIGALWWATSRASFLLALGVAAIVALAAGILLIKDRWPVVGVALVWLTWWGFLLGMIAIVLIAEGRRL